MNNFDLALVWLGFFAAVFLGWYYYLQARNKERMALIEKDADLTEIFKSREIRFRFPWLKLGILFTGLAFGGSLIVWMSIYPVVEKLINKTDGFAIFVAMLLFGGISMIIAYVVDKPKDK